MKKGYPTKNGRGSGRVCTKKGYLTRNGRGSGRVCMKKGYPTDKCEDGSGRGIKPSCG